MKFKNSLFKVEFQIFKKKIERLIKLVFKVCSCFAMDLNHTLQDVPNMYFCNFVSCFRQLKIIYFDFFQIPFPSNQLEIKLSLRRPSMPRVIRNTQKCTDFKSFVFLRAFIKKEFPVITFILLYVSWCGSTYCMEDS